jgi:hypothetical protein
MSFYRPVENLLYAAAYPEVNMVSVAWYFAAKVGLWPSGNSSSPSFCALKAGFAGLGLRDASTIKSFCDEDCQ